MASMIPTSRGDVLILTTTHSFIAYSVGTVTMDGQQDFKGEAPVTCYPDRAAALTAAKALMNPGGHIFFQDIDSGDWSDASPRAERRQVRHA